jgi:hypothetical protein
MTRDSKLIALDLPRILTWTADVGSLSRDVYEGYIEILSETLVEVASEDSQDTVQRLTALPDDSQERILESPDFYNLLARRASESHQQIWSFLNSSIAVEQFRNGMESNSAYRNWSANGDFFADTSTDDRFDTHGWRLSGRYMAPALTPRIPIDHWSIYARHSMPVDTFREVTFGDAVALGQSEFNDAVTKIRSAFQIAETTVPEAAQLVRRFLRTIVIRSNGHDGGFFQSASRNAYLGQAVFLNAQHHSVDLEIVAESIVHESIHSLVWKAEVGEPLMEPGSGDIDPVSSPWSGQTLRYETYLHACIVWYGIFFFWKTVERIHTPFESHRIAVLKKRAQVGFLSAGYRAALDAHKSYLSEGLYSMFVALAESVRAQS